VKIKLTSTLIAMSCLGLFANTQALAQLTPQYVPSKVVAHSSPRPKAKSQTIPTAYTPEVIATPDGVGVDGSQLASNVPPDNALMPNTDNPLVAENQALIDNGLWNGEPMGQCCSICGGGSGDPADWYLEQDVRILNRSRPRDIGISCEFAAENSQLIGNQLLNTRSASPDISAVWGMKVGHYFARDTLNRDHFLEFEFWGLNNWRDEASGDGQRISLANAQGNTEFFGSLYSGYATGTVLNQSNNFAPVWILNGIIVPGFDRADRQTTFYTSSTNNFEVNGRIVPRNHEDRLTMQPNGRWRRECQPGQYVSYLYGLRFLQLNETFRFHSEGTTQVFNPAGVLVDTISNTGDYDVVAHNNLLGLQVGADLTFRQCRWDWGIRSKLGAFVNFSDQVSDIASGVAGSPDFVHRLAASKHEASLIGEVGFHTSYKFRPNLVGHASYDFMWVSGVALAPEQLQFTQMPINRINTNGLAMFQGLTLGMEWLW
jgi:hypothetical protein